jgi:hypothetical protein
MNPDFLSFQAMECMFLFVPFEFFVCGFNLIDCLRLIGSFAVCIQDAIHFMELQKDNAILFYEPTHCSATAIIAAAILYKLKKESVNFQQMISKYNMVCCLSVPIGLCSFLATHFVA